MMVDSNPDADWAHAHACSMYADTRANWADMGSNARPMPACATRMINTDATHDRARLGRHERNCRSRKAQCEDYSFHFCELQRRIHAAWRQRPTGHFGCVTLFPVTTSAAHTWSPAADRTSPRIGHGSRTRPASD